MTMRGEVAASVAAGVRCRHPPPWPVFSRQHPAPALPAAHAPPPVAGQRPQQQRPPRPPWTAWKHRRKLHACMHAHVRVVGCYPAWWITLTATLSTCCLRVGGFLLPVLLCPLPESSDAPARLPAADSASPSPHHSPHLPLTLPPPRPPPRTCRLRLRSCLPPTLHLAPQPSGPLIVILGAGSAGFPAE